MNPRRHDPRVEVALSRRAGRIGWSKAVMGLLMGAMPAFAQPQWTELGPKPIIADYTGRVSAMVCSPTNASRYFAAGADGGVWRTDDGGATWIPLTDHMPTSAIGALAMDPGDENTLYAGTGEANFANHSRYGLGIYKSTDGGNTWSHLAESTFAGRCFSKIVINPQNPQVLYAGITRAGGFPEMAAAKSHPQAAGPLGVFRSTDGGVTWAQLTNGLPNRACTDLAIDPANGLTVYACIGHIFGSTDNGIYKTIDGGDTWVKLAGGLPTASVGRVSIGIAPSNPQRLYALVTRPSDAFGGGASTLNAYRTDNAGLTWTALPIGGIQATYGWYLSVVSVQPTNADTVFMGGLTFHRSQNAGASWAEVTSPHVDYHAVAWDAQGRLLLGGDGGVHRSATLGGSWTDRNDALGLVQFYAGISTHPTDPNIIFAGAQDNGTNRKSSASNAWTHVLGGDGGWTQLDAASPNRVFACYQGTGNIYRSSDGGNGFGWVGSGISTGDRNCFFPPYLIDPVNSNLMLYATHRVYRSTTGGSSWAAISGDLTNGAGAVRALAQSPSNPLTVYAATNDGKVLVSFNGGTSWTTRLTNNPGWPRVTRELFVDPSDDQTAYLAVAAFGTDQVRRTTDAGLSWQALDGDLPDVPVNTIAADIRGPLPTLFSGADDGLYRSINDGQTWHRYLKHLPRTAVIDVRLEVARGRVVVATQGRGVWSAPVGLAGDMNADGSVNPFDITPFVTALTDPAQFAIDYPGVDPLLHGDLTGDSSLNAFDIQPFTDLLSQ